MKGAVDVALSRLDDVENVFLSTLDERRSTDAEKAAVIRNAELVLQTFAVPKRKQLQKNFADYGSSAALIPSNL